MLTKFRTYRALELQNVMRVASYRLRLRLGIHPVTKIKAEPIKGKFFRSPDHVNENQIARSEWRSGVRLFAHHDFPLSGIPDWHANLFTGERSGREDAAWQEIPDFDQALGDIKTVWDLSRFDWVLAMAQRVATGEQAELARLNQWLSDWVKKNPAYKGVNWKCGQEASIRVLHLATSALMAGQIYDPESALVSLVENHLKRIAPTIGYAIGQSNNHGTSEAAALFVGGLWLSRIGLKDAEYWAQTGRVWLENRAGILIMPDGSFSQYSTIYHRMVLDTYVLCEVFRRLLEAEPFSNTLVSRLSAAVDWLEAITDTVTGQACNVGANDGTQILKLSDSPYEDMRPSLHRASLLYRETRAVKEKGPWDHEANWLGINLRRSPAPLPQSGSFDVGGFHVMRRGNTFAMLRYPRFRFRPSQADALHLDVWRDGVNLLTDAGTFSYNHPISNDGYFSSVRAHNTAQFDGRDQMPKLSRFLYANWLTAKDVDTVRTQNETITVAAGYTDARGATHYRRVTSLDDGLKIEDTLKGSKKFTVLRWRLAPGDYTMTSQGISSELFALSIQSDAAINRLELVKARRSRYYFQEEPIPCLEIEVNQDTKVTTHLRW